MLEVCTNEIGFILEKNDLELYQTLILKLMNVFRIMLLKIAKSE